MIGTTLGHYRLEARLGAGGMGVVYRAYDTHLRRQVAVKMLAGDVDATARARLLREARAASGLNHPHICTIHEVTEEDGHAILVMEYVDGQDLTTLIPPTGLPADTIIRYGLQIASALGHAHDRGIVHRDLKATNVVVTSGGSAKVLDFGIAQRLHAADENLATESRPVSAHEMDVAGTLAYMAPEVLQGNAADARSDVWAFGVLLFEMATGGRPFSGRTSFELVSSVLRDPVRALPASVPPGLAAVIQRCLAREPSRRYQRGSEVHAALEAVAPASQPAVAVPARPRSVHAPVRWMLLAGAFVMCAALVLAFLNVAGIGDRIGGRSASVPVIRSIAVLPLDNLSGDPTQEYFADGMTEALISNLARIGALKVISRTSVMRYKETAKSLPEIARELNVDAVVEGSVQRANDRVRITAQLIHAASDTHLWARDYEGAIADTLRLQSDVARAIASEIRIQITPHEQARLAQARAVDPAAYEAFLRGRHHLWQLNEADLKQSIAYFERAVAIDPKYATAYAGLSQAWAERGIWGALDFPTTEGPQRAAAFKALELDNSLADAHAAVGQIAFNRDWDWAGAERHFLKALELDPGCLEARHYYAFALMALGRHVEAVAEIEKAVTLDPLSSALHSTFGRILYRARRYAEAITRFERAIALDPRNFGAYGRLADVYEALGRLDDAFKYNEMADVLRGVSSEWRYSPAVGRLHALAGNRVEALAIVDRAKRAPGAGVRAQHIAEIYAALGDNDQAFAWLNRAIDERQLVAFLKTDPKLDSLRPDPRWPALLRRINLSP